MYKVQTVKKFIQSFKVVGTDLFYKHINKDAYLLKNDNLIDEENHGYFIFNQYLGINNINTTKLINLENDDIEVIPVTFTGRNYHENTILISKDTEREGPGLYSSKYVICQLIPYKELFVLPYRYYGSGYRIKNDYLQLTKERRLIHCLSLLTGEYEWEADLSGRTYIHLGETKEATIQAIIGFWENYLLVSMTHFELVALDINTGKIIWETNDLDSRLKSVFPPHMHYAYTRKMFIEDGFVYEMASSLYYRIDIKTQALEILWKDEREEFITVKYTHHTPKMIYFVASHKNQLQCSILGVFNRKTLEIDWQEDINVQIDPALGYYASVNQAPQATEDKIYVLDTAGTLYIYEKEEKVE